MTADSRSPRFRRRGRADLRPSELRASVSKSGSRRRWVAIDRSIQLDASVIVMIRDGARPRTCRLSRRRGYLRELHEGRRSWSRSIFHLGGGVQPGRGARSVYQRGGIRMDARCISFRRHAFDDCPDRTGQSRQCSIVLSGLSPESRARAQNPVGQSSSPPPVHLSVRDAAARRGNSLAWSRGQAPGVAPPRLRPAPAQYKAWPLFSCSFSRGSSRAGLANVTPRRNRALERFRRVHFRRGTRAFAHFRLRCNPG